jgi:hypothetical protein
MNTKEPVNSEVKPPQSATVLSFDPDKYLDHVTELEMSDAQKVEFLRVLWDIMATFVRMGFGVEPVLQNLFQEVSANATEGIENKIPTHEFNVNADGVDGGPK